MGQNQLLTVDKKTSNRYVVRLEVTVYLSDQGILRNNIGYPFPPQDDSGTKAITMWDKFGEAFVAANRPGQLVFIKNATTSPSPKGHGMLLDCSDFSSSAFHNGTYLVPLSYFLIRSHQLARRKES